jgi:glycosyltransferase involved in cell wall biosynthesis
MTSAQPRVFVSVLVPCWNAETTVGPAIDSVLAERSVELECVVVDDASTDRTTDVVGEVAARDPRVRLIRQAGNQGVSAARNRGLDEIRGEWLTMLDADDRFTPGGLERLVRAAEASDPLAVVGQQVWWNGRRRWVGPLYDIPDIRHAGRKSLASHPGLLYFVAPHAKLFHRSTFEGLRFSGRVLGDQPWIIRALLRAGPRIDVIDETVYEWYRPVSEANQSSITARTRSSARRGVEAAKVAEGAFAAVAAEAAGLLPGDAAAAVLDRYVERLLRSDLGVHLALALARRDPTIGELIDAIAAFVASVPARHVAASDALARDILEPPLASWSGVDGAGRAAYWRLLDGARVADPAVVDKLGTRGRLALRIAATWPPAVAGPALLANGVVSRSEARLWRLARFARSVARPP